jgi:hypothetical protein
MTGSFTMGLRLARKKETIAEFTVAEEKGITPTPKQDAFLERLRELNIGLYFLSDDRTVQLAGQERRETLSAITQEAEKQVISYSGLTARIAGQFGN